MAFKQTYSAVRNATWIYYTLAFVFFVMAVQQFPTPRNVDGSMVLFIFFSCLAAGTAFGAGRNKRAAARKMSRA